MRELEFKVPIQWDNKEAKFFLRQYCNISNRLLIKLKQVENGITLNNKHIRVVDCVKYNDIIKIKIPDKSSDEITPTNIKLEIIYEDCDLIVINKPSNMPVHPSIGHTDDTLVNALCYYYESKSQPCSFRIQNRLDRDTSGLVVVSKNQHIASVISKNLKKTYYAICENEITGCGVIDLPIRLKAGYGITREVGINGEQSITQYQSIGCGKSFSLVKINLITGRTHQIRTHFSHIHYPLAGDDMYGGHLDFIKRQALHCKTIDFTHPITGKIIHIDTEFPSDMKKLLDYCEIKY